MGDSRKIRAIKCILNENNARYCRNHMDLNDQQSTFFMLRIFEIKKNLFWAFITTKVSYEFA